MIEFTIAPPRWMLCVISAFSMVACNGFNFVFFSTLTQIWVLFCIAAGLPTSKVYSKWRYNYHWSSKFLSYHWMLHLAAEESVTVKFTLWCCFNSFKLLLPRPVAEPGKVFRWGELQRQVKSKEKKIYRPHSHSAITQVIEKSACKIITK